MYTYIYIYIYSCQSAMLFLLYPALVILSCKMRAFFVTASNLIFLQKVLPDKSERLHVTEMQSW